MWFLIPLILILGALVVIGIIVVKKVPQLRMIDIDSMPSEKMRRTKEQLIMKRFDRMTSDKLGRVGKLATGTVDSMSKVGRRAVQKLYAMEQYYQKVKTAPANGEHGIDSDTVKRLLDEAEKYTLEEDYIQAEKRYIEVISHHPKHIDAYEGLGNVYIRAKQFEQARETLLFVSRIAPDDASVQASLAELEIKEENFPAAVTHMRKAVEKRPGNPKYLDLYIESSLGAKMKEDAEKGLKLLKESNPENKKIASFEEQIKRLAA